MSPKAFARCFAWSFVPTKISVFPNSRSLQRSTMKLFRSRVSSSSRLVPAKSSLIEFSFILKRMPVSNVTLRNGATNPSAASSQNDRRNAMASKIGIFGREKLKLVRSATSPS